MLYEVITFNRLFGSYRTLRLLAREGETDTMLALLPTVTERFAVSAIDTENAASQWFSVTIDQEKTNLSDVLSWALTSLPVRDVKIQEISTESVIAKVYAGGLAPNAEGGPT